MLLFCVIICITNKQGGFKMLKAKKYKVYAINLYFNALQLNVAGYFFLAKNRQKNNPLIKRGHFL